MAYFDKLFLVKFTSKPWKIKGRVQSKFWQGIINYGSDLVENGVKLKKKIMAYFDKLFSVKFTSKSWKIRPSSGWALTWFFEPDLAENGVKLQKKIEAYFYKFF